VDGNKRTAFVVLFAFLERNGLEFTAPNAEVVSIMLALAAGDLGEDDLARWIESRARER
jgi:death-on-curing protein